MGSFLAGVIKQVHSSTLNSYRSWISKTEILRISAANWENFDLHYFIWKRQKYEFFQASYMRDTRLSGSVKEETTKWKGKGKEERRPFARTAGERKALQLLCWLPPSLSSESTQVLGLLVGCDLLADGMSDELQATDLRVGTLPKPGVLQWPQVHVAWGDGWNPSHQRREVCCVPTHRQHRSVCL